MSLEQQIRDALLQLVTNVQQELATRAESIATELAAAAERERREAVAQETSAFEARLMEAQSDGERFAEREREDAERTAAEEIARARAEIEALRDQLAARQAEAQRVQEHAQALRVDATRAQEQFETAAAELALLRDQVVATEEALAEAQGAADSVRAEERHGEMAELDALLAAVRRIGEAQTLTGVLEALADSVGAQTARTAIFVAGSGAFQPFRLRGFDGYEARALSPAEADNLSRGLPFAPLPPERAGFSVPIEIAGKTVAVAYADDASGDEPPVPSAWPEAIQILAMHAALRLETLTALRTLQVLGTRQNPGAPVATAGVDAPSTTADDQSARRYARLLVSEIKLYNEGAVRLGRQNRDLLDRLRPEIDRARRLYEERVPANVPARATYFDDELVQTLADGDPGLLGSR
jgi:hypothetical protein